MIRCGGCDTQCIDQGDCGGGLIWVGVKEMVNGTLLGSWGQLFLILDFLIYFNSNLSFYPFKIVQNQFLKSTNGQINRNCPFGLYIRVFEMFGIVGATK